MRTKVLEEWMYPERGRRERGDPDRFTWWGRRELKEGNQALAKGVVINVVKSTMEGPWRPVMRSLKKNDQPDDEPVMKNRYRMSRRVVNEAVTRVKMWRIPQLVMKSWGKPEFQWPPVRLK